MSSVNLDFNNMGKLGRDFTITLNFKDGKIVETTSVKNNDANHEQHNNEPYNWYGFKLPSFLCKSRMTITSPITGRWSNAVSNELYQQKLQWVDENKDTDEDIVNLRELYNRFYKLMLKIYKYHGHKINPVNYVWVNGAMRLGDSVSCEYHDGFVSLHNWESHVWPKIIMPWIYANKDKLLMLSCIEGKFNAELMADYHSNQVLSGIFHNCENGLQSLFNTLVIYYNYDIHAIEKHMNTTIWATYFPDQKWDNVQINC